MLKRPTGAELQIADEPSFNAQTEVLLDLRDIDCQLSTTDIFELAEHMAFPNPALDTHRKIAVLVSGHLSFDHARFFELCARNRGVNVQAFDEYEAADEWLYAELPPDPNEHAAAEPRLADTSQIRKPSHPRVGALLYKEQRY